MAEQCGERGELEKVCNFLLSRGVVQDIVDNFEYEKMDVEAITQASDNELLLLGLDKKGDILSLRSFVQKLSKGSSKDERRLEKMSLLRDVLEGGKGTKKLKQHQDAKSSPKTRKVQLGWLHFDDEKQTFFSVRTAKGGGTREVDIKLSADKNDIIDIAKAVFFPDNKSTFGPEQCMAFGLANFQHEDISRIKVCGVYLAFTLQRYIEKCKMSRVWLYLTSKSNTLDMSPLKEGDQKMASSSKPDTKTCDHTKSKLEKRRKLISEQDAAYEESLATDRAKRQKLVKEVQDVDRQNKLQQSRLLRTPQEPKESEQSTSVEIKVRHVSLGIVTRNFRDSECMACVYDWVGSLSLIPEHFQLLDYTGMMLLPSQAVKEAAHTTLYMSETMSTPPLEDDEEVTFVGFGNISDSNPIAGADSLLEPIREIPPEQLLDWDESFSSELENDYNVQHQITKDDRRNRKTDGGRLFRQHYLPLLTGQQSPTRFTNVGVDEIEIAGSKESSSNTGSSSGGSSGGSSGTSSGGSSGGSSGSSGGSSSGGSSGGSGIHSGESGSGSSGGTMTGGSGGTSNGSSDEGNGGSSGESNGGGNGGSFDGSDSNGGEQRILRVRRSLVLQDLLTEFLDEGIMTCELKIIVVDGYGRDERGEDLRGIYRDALSSFWQEFYISCTLGERGRVPSIRHDFQSNHWAAVGRIIAKGYKDLGYFPVMLSKAFVVSTMFGEKAVSDDVLLQSFKEYLAPSEEQVVCEALIRPGDKWDSVDRDDEDLLELLDRFGCRSLPTKENIKTLILEVAHKEIIQKAQYVADCWDDIFRGSLVKGKLSTLEGVCNVYESLEPTTRKVLGMVSAFPMTNAEQAALDYLKRFIRGLEISQLKSFLMFTTGADVICVSTIQIEFTKLEGLGRRPIAHTCGCVLEIPSTYDSYAEFRAEFTNLLAKEKWQNDIM